MNPKTFIFIGRSGSGKGTQASLLIEYLKKDDPEKRVLHLETGQEFRKLREGTGPTSRIVKEIYDKGGLMPEFLPIWLWSDFLVNNLKESDHLVVDGVARRVREAEILDSALKFYKREKLFIVHINVKRGWAFDRLMARKRADDNADDINARLDWFESEVSKSLAYYAGNPDYKVLDINGEQTIEEVHEEIVEKLLFDSV